jgi:tRNA(Ile)-lysidine synthase
MSPVRRAALLRRWLAFHRAAMPSRAMLSRIWDEVALAREDASRACT